MNQLPAPEPHNRESEEALLGSVLMNPERYLSVSHILTPADFYIHRNGWIWEVFGVLTEKNFPIDALSVTNELEAKGRLNEAGGAAYIAELMSRVPHSRNISNYAETVEISSARRRMLSIASDIAQRANDSGKSVTESVDETVAALYSLNGRVIGDIPDAVDAALDFAELIRSERLCVPTGIENLDYLTGGMERRKQTVLGGRTGLGKTAFLSQLAQGIALLGMTALYFSLEMDKEDIIARRICGLENISYRDIVAGRVKPEDIERLAKSGMEYAERLGSRFLIDDKPNRTTDEMFTIIRRVNPDAVFVDHLALVGNQCENENLRLGRITWGLKKAAKIQDFALISACQLNRYGQKRVDEEEDREPELYDLRDSGNIEQNADNVWFLHSRQRKSEEERKAPKRIDMDLLIKKFRMGPRNMKCKLTYDLPRQWFEPREKSEWAPPPEPELFEHTDI